MMPKANDKNMKEIVSLKEDIYLCQRLALKLHVFTRRKK